jgi:predicted AAA+ superfamily ATPase
MFFPRFILPHLEAMLKKFPVVSVTGPRQAGKTTLLRHAFPRFHYVNFEQPDQRLMFAEDPLGFLRSKGPQIIFDEVQNVPDVFSYVQALSDERGTPGQYILSGSQSFLLNQRISQSLAGRVYVAHLLPLTLGELPVQEDLYTTIFKGFYPRLHAIDIHPSHFYPSYVQTYIERDVRMLKAIEDLNAFARFLRLCAGRVGQLLNLTSLAGDAGISVNTAKAWLSVLEASYIIFLLQPWHRSLNKRLIKAPKLYFYDTGLASYLLLIQNPEMVQTHYLYGGLFENMIISDIVKQYYNAGRQPNVFFWRESNGTEIDCIVEKETEVLAMEIKGGLTYTSDFIKNLKRFPDEGIRKMVIYGGNEDVRLGNISLHGWRKISSITGIDPTGLSS